MKDNNGKYSRTLNIITQNFAVALGSTLSETLKIPPSSLASTTTVAWDS